MFLEIKDTLNHRHKIQLVDINRGDIMQITPEITMSNGVNDARTSGNKLYREKALAQIRNSLLPFANEGGLSSAGSTVSTLSSTTTKSSGIGSYASGTSSASGSSSPCCQNGVEKDLLTQRQMLHQLKLVGYEEELACKLIKISGARSMEQLVEFLHNYQVLCEPVQNGYQWPTGVQYAPRIMRKSSIDSGVRLTRCSPALESSTCSTRSDSPCISIGSIRSAYSDPPPRLTPHLLEPRDPPRLTPHLLDSRDPPRLTPHLLESHDLSLSRQCSPNCAMEPPPPPPPRTQANSRGTTPPPPSFHHTNGFTASQMQHMLKRISPVQMVRHTPGSVYSSSQSSTPQRGTSPVIVHNSAQVQQHLTHQLQALSIYNNATSPTEPPPPYPIGLVHASSVNSKLVSPVHFSSPSPVRQNSNEFPVSSSQIQRISPSPFVQPQVSGPVLSPATVVTTPAPKPAPLQSWPARQPAIIMQSVKSTQVQKPVLQTAVAPTAPRASQSPPPPSYSATMQQKALECQQSLIAPTSTQQCNGISLGVPTTDPPSYHSTIALSTQQRVINASPNTTSLFNNTSVSSFPTLHDFPPEPKPEIPAKPGTADDKYSVPPPLPPHMMVKANLHGEPPPPPPYPSSQAQRKFSPMTAGPVPSRSDSPASHTNSQSPVSSVHSDCTQDTCSSAKSDADCAHKTTHQSPIPERKVFSKEKEEERRETKVRNYSPRAYKFFMEQHVENLLKSYHQRMLRRVQLETEMEKVGLTEEAQCQMRKMLHQKESNYIRLKRAKMDRSMFVKIKTIGVGAFGEVTLVRKIDTSHLYAMKTLRKADVLKRNQVAHVKAERDILAEADNEWVVKLFYSFQDKDNLYFVMEYIPGGDLMGLLTKFEIFDQDLARFYTAEIVCAVESVHKMGFIHRDIKPDNILIDRNGHIRLTDFGLCTGFRWTHNSKYYQTNGDHNRQDSMEPDEDWNNDCRCKSTAGILKPLERRRRREHQRCLAHSLVGTPNYIAPEVLRRTGYTQLCDWWSVGVILYEMVVGRPPFHAGSPADTQIKIINWESSLCIPPESNLEPETQDLIIKLCTSEDRRLGRNGPHEVRSHPFFSDVDFDGGLRKCPAPYCPTIRFATDTSNFDDVDPDKLWPSDYEDKKYDNGKHPEHAFFEFTFRRFFDDGGHACPLSTNSETGENQSGPVYL